MNTQPNIEQLMAEINALKAENERLRKENHDAMLDASYGCPTRYAVDRRWAHADKSEQRTAVFGDLRGIHAINTEFGGYEEVDNRVKHAMQILQLRHEDAIFGRWKSGDEFIFIIQGNDADGFMRRVEQAFEEARLIIDMGAAEIVDHDLQQAMQVAARIAMAKKPKNTTR